MLKDNQCLFNVDHLFNANVNYVSNDNYYSLNDDISY